MENRHYLFILGCHCPHSPSCPFLAEGNPVQPAPGWLKTPSKVGPAGSQRAQDHSLTLGVRPGLSWQVEVLLLEFESPVSNTAQELKAVLNPCAKAPAGSPIPPVCHWCVLGVCCNPDPKAQAFEGIKCGGLEEWL